jgi:ACDE family multidrug resistance protein
VRLTLRPRAVTDGALAQFFLSAGGLPLFSTFFLWAFGTGAVQLARPLFAASFGVPVLLVSLVTSSNAVSRLVTAPVTGILMDRWGRRPLLIAGVVLRGVSATLEFFVDDYLLFLLLEFVGGIGVSIWATGSNILIGDVSTRENRGMAVAVRSFSVKLGTILGPIAGGAIAASFLDLETGLRWIFLFNAATKVVMLAILLWLVRETRPTAEPAQADQGGPPRRSALDASRFLNRPFLAVAAATLAISTMSGGVIQALFPVFSAQVVGLATYDVGVLLTLAGVTSMLISFPNGWLVDRLGHRASLTPGLLVMAASAFLLAVSNSYAAIAVVVLIYGVGEGMSQGSSQAYAIDLAPEQGRGAFLGVWSLLQNGGTIVAALLVGGAVDRLGYGTALQGTAIFLALSAVLFWIAGSTRQPAGHTA